MVTLAMRSFVSSTAVDLPVRITRLYVCIDVGLYMFIKVGTYMCIKVSLSLVCIKVGMRAHARE